MAGGGEDALGEGVHLDGEARGHGGEDGGVDADARLLHAQKDGDEREVHGAVEVEERVGVVGEADPSAALRDDNKGSLSDDTSGSG